MARGILMPVLPARETLAHQQRCTDAANAKVTTSVIPATGVNDK
jgi:hypothetical protein